MSMVATRSPLIAIGMNGAGPGIRRSARLSVEGQDDGERPSKKPRVEEVQGAKGTKENGTGKRARGKGRFGRSSRWSRRAGFYADS
jgi:hypothetical protein